MNKYESVIIINPNVDEAGLKALEEKFTGLINENGKVEEVVDADILADANKIVNTSKDE